MLSGTCSWLELETWPTVCAAQGLVPLADSVTADLQAFSAFDKCYTDVGKSKKKKKNPKLNNLNSRSLTGFLWGFQLELQQ